MSVRCRNLPELRASFRAVHVATKKDESDIVNKGLKDIAFRAAQFTVKTTVAKIKSGLNKVLLARLAAKELRKSGRYTLAQLKDMMRRILKSRTSHVSALRAGWIPSILAFGGKFRGAKPLPNSSAAHGGGTKATPSKLKGMITNTLETINFSGGRVPVETIPEAVSALERAVAFVAADRFAYARRKIDATLRKHSDK